MIASYDCYIPFLLAFFVYKSGFKKVSMLNDYDNYRFYWRVYICFH